jgi:uncharacterized protein YgiM (DUF1202 family)
MIPIRKLLAVLIILVIALSACNLSTNPPSADPLSAASTIVAQTLQAHGSPTTQGLIASTPFASPAVATATAKPTLFINTDKSKCRSGPGPDFKVIATFSTGTTVDLVAKDSADSYWLVKDPSSANMCFVQAQDATPAGSFESLPEVTPQPATNNAPARPGSINYTFSCDNTSVTTKLSWSDNANNENGYHVDRLGSQIADLPPNSNSYTDTIDYTLGAQMTYSVEAYNDAGVSQSRTITFTCGQ